MIWMPRNQRDIRCYFHPGMDVSGDDNSPYSQSVTLVGSPTISSSGLILNGTDQYATYPDAASNSLFDELTVWCWFNVDTLDATSQILVSKYDFGNNNRSFRFLINGASDSVGLRLSPDGTSTGNSEVTSTSTVTTVSDVFVVGVWDGSQHKLYFNGVEEASSFYSSGVYDGNELIALGADFSGAAPAEYFDGTIYQAGVAGHAFSPYEIGRLYRLGKDYQIPVGTKQLIGYEDCRSLIDWETVSGSFHVRQQSTTGKNYFYCVSNGSLKITSEDYSGANFADTSTTISGSPTVTRNSSDITLAMTAGDGLAEIVVRRA